MTYFEGAIKFSARVIACTAGGDWFGHTISFANKLTTDYDGPNGFNWIPQQMPLLRFGATTNEVMIIVNPTQAIKFTRPSFSDPFSCIVQADEYQLTDTSSGYVFTKRTAMPKDWNVVTQPVAQLKISKYAKGVAAVAPLEARRIGTAYRTMGGVEYRIEFNSDGLFQRYSDRTTSVQVTSSSSTLNLIYEMQREYTISSTTVLQSMVYTYHTSGLNQNRMEYATYKRKINEEPWEEITRAHFEYYDGTEAQSESHGSLGDLKKSTVQYNSGGAWTDVATRYNRYYKSGEGGFVHGLKYTVGPEAFRRMLLDGLTPETATNSALAPYADHYFEYGGDRSVSKEIAGLCGSCGSGTSGDTFFYVPSDYDNTGFNRWAMRTTVFHTNNTQDVVYTNHFGQVMLRIFEDTSVTPSRKWYSNYFYDQSGRVIETATSSVMGVNENSPDLLSRGQAATDLISDTDGVIYNYIYPSSNIGQLQEIRIRHGQLGTAIPLLKLEYYDSLSHEFLHRVTSYPDETTTAVEIKTEYAYLFHSGTSDVKQRTTTLPAAAAGQNGSGTAPTVVEEYDLDGNLTWHKDERGIITRFLYDAATGRLAQRVDDVNTAQYVDEPSGWATAPGAGSHLVTDHVYDERGRMVQTLGPSHEAIIGGTPTTVRTALWHAYKASLTGDEKWTGRGYATGSGPSYTYTLVDPVLIEKFDRLNRPTDVMVSKRSTGSGKLIATDTFAQTDWKRWTSEHYNNKGHHTATRTYHTIPSSGEGTSVMNYIMASYGYDTQDRLNRIEAGEQITGIVRDVFDRPVTIDVGTSDAVGQSDMKNVAELEYDGGLAGKAGNLTKVTLREDDTNTRVTTYGYDWRDRLTSIDGEVDRYVEFTYDNMDRLTKVDRRNTNSSGNLIGRQEIKHNDRDEVYRVISYAVDPLTTDPPSNALTTDYWRDAAGNPIKITPAGAGKAFWKNAFDSLGRVTKQYAGFDTDESTYAEADDVDGDTILTQSETSYDDAGNVLLSTARERLHDATGTGNLTTTVGTQPQARVTHMGAWYDALGRTLAVADYGTNGDTLDGSGSVADLDANDDDVPDRPSALPVAGDNLLVSTASYDDAGAAFEFTDPKGHEFRRVLDHAARLTKVIEAYDDGDPTTGMFDRDRVTEYDYGTNGRLEQITAKRYNSADDQITRYVYGTSLSDSAVASGRLLRAVIYPDSDDASSPLGDGTDAAYDRVELKYNRLGQITELKDQNQTVHAYDYDKLGRRLHDRVTAFGTNVDQTVKRISRTYEVRGLVEKVSSYDSATAGGGSVINEVQSAYNTFGQLTTEYQEHGGAVSTSTSPKVQYVYADGASGSNHVRRTGITYPSGRAIDYTYGTSGGIDDLVHRIASLEESATALVSYTRLGGGGSVRVELPQPSLRLDLWGGSSGTYDGIDRFGRVTKQKWGATSGTVKDEFLYGYDRNSNRTSRDNTQTSDLDELYTYDQLDRLIDMKRGTISGGSIASPVREQHWVLGRLGNWSELHERQNGAQVMEQYRSHNKANETGAVSDIVSSINWVDPVHDTAGNMTTLPRPNDPGNGYTATYDAWDRLVELKAGSDTVAKYKYDGTDARTVKETYSGGILSETRHFYYSTAWRLLEERLGTSTTPDRQYVWGRRYRDELVLRDRDADASSGNGLEERLYALQDANFNVTALADTTGAVVERYSYTPYGDRTILTGSWGSRTSSSYAWDHGHQGLMHDPESGLIQNRLRYLHAGLGRFTSRDPLGYVDGLNVYEYVRSGPLFLLDPFGTQSAYDREMEDELMSGVSETEDEQRREDDRDNLHANAEGGAAFVDEASKRTGDELTDPTNLAGGPALGLLKRLGKFAKWCLRGRKGADAAGDAAGDAVKAAEKAAADALKDVPLKELQESVKAKAGDFRKVFGSGPGGANSALDLAKQGKLGIPEGLTRQDLRNYREIARRQVEGGLDASGVQARRIEIIDALLD